MDRMRTGGWEALEAAIDGDVLRPGEPGYEAVRKPAIARFHDVLPEAVVRCRSAGDVAETLRFAASAGLPVAPRSGGHDFAGRSTTPGIVVDVGPMDSVELSGGLATVGAGARLGGVYDALDARGVTIPAGCGPEVGVAGLVLGGGIGILGRLHGLTCDWLEGARIVLFDGREAECDDELLWALRGAGGGRFGVVCSFTFRTLAPPPATAFDVRFPASAAPALIDAWQRAELPDELAASVHVTAPPAEARLFGAMLAGEAETRAALSFVPLDPESASFFSGSYRDVKRHLSGYGGPDPGHPYSRSEFFRRPLPAEVVAALVDHLVSGPGGARELDFSPWGGAYNRVAADATAFPHREERFMLKHTVVLQAGEPTEAARRWLDRSWELVHPYGTGGVYVNFPDPLLEDEELAYWGVNHDRLQAIRRGLPAAPGPSRRP